MTQVAEKSCRKRRGSKKIKDPQAESDEPSKLLLNMEAATDCTEEKSAAQRKQKIAKVTFSDSERSDIQKGSRTGCPVELEVIRVMREWYCHRAAAGLRGSW